MRACSCDEISCATLGKYRLRARQRPSTTVAEQTTEKLRVIEHVATQSSNTSVCILSSLQKQQGLRKLETASSFSTTVSTVPCEVLVSCTSAAGVRLLRTFHHHTVPLQLYATWRAFVPVRAVIHRLLRNNPSSGMRNGIPHRLRTAVSTFGSCPQTLDILCY